MNLRKLLFSLTPMSLMAATTVDINTTAYPTLANFVTLRDAVNTANAGPDINVIQFTNNIFGGTINLTEDNPTLNGLPAIVSNFTIGQAGANMTIDGGASRFQWFGFAPAQFTAFNVNGINFQNGSFNILNDFANVTLGSQVNFGPNSIISINAGGVLNGNLNLTYGSGLGLQNSGALMGNVNIIGTPDSISMVAMDNGYVGGSINLNANTVLTLSSNSTVTGSITAMGADANNIALIQLANGLGTFGSMQLNGNAILMVSDTGVATGPITLNGSSPLAFSLLDLSGTGTLTTQPVIQQYGLVSIHNGGVLGHSLNLVNHSQLILSNGQVNGTVTVDPTSIFTVLPNGGAVTTVFNQGTTVLSSTLTSNSYTTSGQLQVALNSPTSGLINTQTVDLGGVVQLARGSDFYFKGMIAPIINYNTLVGQGTLGLSYFDQQRIQVVTPTSYNYPGASDPSFAESIYLLLKANFIGFTQFSGNAGVVQNYLQYAVLNPDLMQVITAVNLLPTDQAQANALAQLSPAQYGAFDWASGALMNQIASLVAKQGICNCSCYENQYVWVATTGQFLNQKNIEELHGFDADGWGVFAGYERQIGGNWSLGVVAGYNDDYLKWHTNYGRGSLQQATFGLHANYCDEERLDIDALVLGGYQHFSSHRLIGFTGLPTRRAESSVDGWITTGRFQIEKAFDDNGWIFIPFGLFEYTYMQRGSMQEKGAGTLDLFVHHHNASFFRAELGPSIARTLFFPWVTFTPMFRFGWNWIVPTSGKRFTADLAGQDSSITVLSTKQVLNFPTAELCLVCDFCFDLDLIISYENQFASQFNNQNVSIELAWEF